MSFKPKFGPEALRSDELSDIPEVNEHDSGTSKTDNQVSEPVKKTTSMSGGHTSSTSEDKVTEHDVQIPIKDSQKVKDDLKRQLESQFLSDQKSNRLRTIFQVQSLKGWLFYCIIAAAFFNLSKAGDVTWSVINSLLFPFAILLIERVKEIWNIKPYQLLTFLWHLAIKSYGLAAILLPFYAVLLIIYFLLIYVMSFLIGAVGLIYTVVRVIQG